ncbi:MAG: restriction endonuclease subunit S [Caldilineaceae bacterium]|nr:restriction endonuclease subunit S [Caldilineaceae bacterium]
MVQIILMNLYSDETKHKYDDSADRNSAPLPDGWLRVELGAVTQLIVGQSPPSSTYNTKGLGLPFFQGKAEFGELYPTPVKYCSDPKRIAQPNDVLISVRAPVGPTNLGYEVSCIGRGLIAIRPEIGMPSRYFLYFLRSIENDWGGYTTGTTFDAINSSQLSSRKIPLAPLNEQHRIVEEIESCFTRLDAAVASLRRAQAQLHRYRTSLLKAACEGRLVPTEAELARAEDRPFEDGSTLLGRILAERRRRWEADNRPPQPKDDKWKAKYRQPAAPDLSALPALPEGWVWATVEQLGKVQLGRQRAPQHHDGPYMRPYLRVANVFEDRIDTSDVMEMNFTPEEYEKYKLEYGDILLNEGQSPEFLGRPAMYRDEVPGACFQNTLIRFRTLSSLMPKFALIMFRAYMHKGRFRQESQITTNIAHLSAGRFAKIEFPLPPLAEQQRIVEEVERRLSLIDQQEAVIRANLRRAARLRQSILKRAFAGQLVAQDLDDEPASVLLQRVQQETLTRR